MYAFPMETPFLRSTRLILHYAPVYINLKDRKKKEKRRKKRRKKGEKGLYVSRIKRNTRFKYFLAEASTLVQS